MSRVQEGERALLSAIFDQAFSDAISKQKGKDWFPREARAFIDDKNPLFCLYCDLLDMRPDYVARKIQERIRKHDLKPLKQFRE